MNSSFVRLTILHPKKNAVNFCAINYASLFHFTTFTLFFLPLSALTLTHWWQIPAWETLVEAATSTDQWVRIHPGYPTDQSLMMVYTIVYTHCTRIYNIDQYCLFQWSIPLYTPPSCVIVWPDRATVAPASPVVNRQRAPAPGGSQDPKIQGWLKQIFTATKGRFHEMGVPQ